MEGVSETPSLGGETSVPAAPQTIPIAPTEFPRVGSATGTPKTPLGAREAVPYRSKRRQTGAARHQDGTRTRGAPRHLRWKGNQRSTIHRSQQRWRPSRPPEPSPPGGGEPKRAPKEPTRGNHQAGPEGLHETVLARPGADKVNVQVRNRSPSTHNWKAH